MVMTRRTLNRTLTLVPFILTLAMIFAAAFANGQTSVYVTPTAKHYHLFADCQTLKRSTKVTTVELKDIGARTLCGFCRHRAADAQEGRGK